MMENAKKAGVSGRIEAHQCRAGALGLEPYDGAVDFALASMMVHEVPDKDRLIREIYAVLREGGLLLFAEPVGHVSKSGFARSLELFERGGFRMRGKPRIAFCRSALLVK